MGGPLVPQERREDAWRLLTEGEWNPREIDKRLSVSRQVAANDILAMIADPGAAHGHSDAKVVE